MTGFRRQRSQPIGLGLAILLALLLVQGVISSVLAGPPSAPGPASVHLPAVYRDYAPSVSRLGLWIGGGGASTLDLLRDSGAHWALVTLSWSAIERSPGSYDFGAYDGRFATLGAREIHPIVEVRENPAWAATTTCGPIDKPGGLDAFERFLEAAVRRYGQPPYDVHDWELYNEPDNTDSVGHAWLGGCWGNHPTEYAQLLQRAKQAVKRADPRARVLIGGLAYENLSNFNTRFLDEVLDAGGGAHFDVANVHYYSSQNPTWSAYGWDIAGKVGAMRANLARHGLTKPVAVTELSWTSTDGSDPAFAELQARYVPKVLARGLAADVYAMTWFWLVDWQGAGVPYGLVDAQGRQRPAYRAYQVAAEQFGEAESVRALAPGEVGAAGGIEGYAFRVRGEERWVLWARQAGRPDGENASARIALPAGAKQTLDKLGQPIPLPTTVGDSPIYVRF